MTRWKRIREFLAVGADVIAVAMGLGFIVTVIVGVWNQASVHLSQPWLTLLLIGVFLLVAGLAGRGLRYLPQPSSYRPSRDATAQSPAPLPPRKLRTGPPIPIPPLDVEARTNGLNLYLAITNKDIEPVDIHAEAIALSGVGNGANLPWRMLWVGGGDATCSMKPDEIQIVDVGGWKHQGKPPFVLHSPMGDIDIGAVKEFTLRVRVHYDNEHTDYAVTVTHPTPDLADRLVFTASVIEWDKR
jgi:hypothetical protein